MEKKVGPVLKKVPVIPVRFENNHHVEQTRNSNHQDIIFKGVEVEEKFTNQLREANLAIVEKARQDVFDKQQEIKRKKLEQVKEANDAEKQCMVEKNVRETKVHVSNAKVQQKELERIAFNHEVALEREQTEKMLWDMEERLRREYKERLKIEIEEAVAAERKRNEGSNQALLAALAGKMAAQKKELEDAFAKRMAARDAEWERKLLRAVDETEKLWKQKGEEALKKMEMEFLGEIGRLEIEIGNLEGTNRELQNLVNVLNRKLEQRDHKIRCLRESFANYMRSIQGLEQDASHFMIPSNLDCGDDDDDDDVPVMN